jgi:hypothetical protein
MNMNGGRILVVLAMISVVAFAGCEGGSGPYVEHANVPAAGITPRQSWSASGRGVSDAALAIDGNPATRAVGGEGGAGASLTIDLGRPCLFNHIIIEHGEDPLAFASRLSVLTSADGVNFTRQMTGTGKRRTTHLPIVTPTLGRYVRIQVTQPGYRGWSVAEIQVK